MRSLAALLIATILSAADWPASVAVGNQQLELRGAARFTYLWFDVYDVALHLPPGSTIADPVPRRLAFRYLRAFTAAELAKATTKTTNERIGTAPRTEVERGVAAINALWPAVTTGDELVLAYQPGSGTTVSRNGSALGTVPGDAFAGVLFSIWLGTDPIDDDLRDGLLARR